MQDATTEFSQSGDVSHCGRGFAFDSRSVIGKPDHFDVGVRFCVAMTPITFLALAPELDMWADWSWPAAKWASGGSLHPACLHVDFDPDYGLESYPAIVNHDGRHRMAALCAIGAGNEEVPVLVSSSRLLEELDAEVITSFRTAAWSQPSRDDVSALIRGPLFGDAALAGTIFPAGALDELHQFIVQR